MKKEMVWKKRRLRRQLQWGTLLAAVPLALASGPAVSAESAEQVEPRFSVTQDRFNTQLKLNLTLDNPQMAVKSSGEMAEAFRFYIYSNYSERIASYKITVYAKSDRFQTKPLAVVNAAQVNPYEAVTWNGQLTDGTFLAANGEYQTVLEVTGKDGKVDFTEPAYFYTLAKGSDRLVKETSELDSKEVPGFGDDRTAHRGMTQKPGEGKVVLQAANLEGISDIRINGQSVQIDENGRAMREFILPAGEHEFILSWVDAQGVEQERKETISLEKPGKREIFFVAMADLTWSKNSVTGPGKEILSVDDHYDGTSTWDGRIVFYLKGNINDKYRLTAHMDTTEERLEDMFGNIGQKDPRRFTRELNPLDHYPVYGDDSTTESDVDTEGRFYIKLERGKDHLLWGNYNSGITGSEFLNYNRSLYGAQYLHQSESVTKYGQMRSYLNLFTADSESRASHNEFLSTGGSLYYLKHQRVTEGTLKITVEIRDQDTGRVKGTSTLTEGIDYEIDNFQGRILLTRPLPMNVGTESIISGSSLLGGDEVYLVTDYEYYSDGFDMDNQGSQGVRGYRWLGDHFRVGAGYIRQDGENSKDYQLWGADLTWRPAKGTYTYLEYAQSDQNASDIFTSDNGGLNFQSISLGGSEKGKAYKVEQVIDFQDFSNTPLSFKGYYSKKQKGFSSLSDALDSDLLEYGAELKYDFVQDQKGLYLKHTYEEDKGNYEERITGLQYYSQLGSSWKGAVEVQDRRENLYDGNGTTRETLAGVKLEKSFRGGQHKVYVAQQVTLDKSGDVDDNNKTTLGFESQVRKDLKILGEVFGSNRGGGGALGVNYDMNDRASFYTKVTNDVDSTSGRGIKTVFGANWKARNDLELYSEQQFQSLNTERTTSDVYGVRYKPSTNRSFDLSYSQGTVSKTKNRVLNGSNDTDRQVWSLAYGYDGPRIDWRSKVEYRWEDGANEISQWVTTNRIKTREKAGWRWLGQFDYAWTDGNDDTVANFIEAAVGFAYRPVKHDKLNLFGKVTFIRGMDPDDQMWANTDSYGNTVYSSDDYEQRTTVFALEGVYELNSRWEVAGKAAYRRGDVRYAGESEWYSGDAALYAARVNWKVNKFWETQLEYRTLRSDAAEDAKNGWVASVYRKIGNNAKVGVGYNWTEYNDDLTRLNYDSKGWFVNLVGKW